ncbi:hypothetical protein NP493_1962g00000 [Ridgeia piscesae]|uniref:Uncharacterized protein n=1 Tax=Ridgeia piscesae TaxID=27915 RepID=A0AAD9N4E1_RIDPI|nr:hypothetical protein NP493_1962g00000 [Ridgeia piscesae]
MSTALTSTSELSQSRMNLVHIYKRSVTTNSVGRSHLLSSIIPTFIRGCKRREAGLCVLTNNVVCGSVFVAWSRPHSQGCRVMHRRRCLTSPGD